MTTTKCQAKNPSACSDPQCPERRGYQHGMANATSFREYSLNRERKEKDPIHQRQQQQGKQAFISNFPKPPAKPAPTPPGPPRPGGPRPVPTPTPPRPGAPRPGQPRQAVPLPKNVKVEYTRNGEPIVKYHKDLGFPTGFNKPEGSRELMYSDHAIDEGRNDRYARDNEIPRFPKVNLSTMNLIEVKMIHGTNRPYRMLYRTELDDTRDICMVLQPAGPGKMRVVTQWINEANDSHKTLRAGEYVDMRQSA